MAKDTLQKATGAAMTAKEQQAKQSVNQALNAMLDGEKLRGRINELLGKRAPQFVSSMVSLVNSDANLQTAFWQSPMSVIQSCLKAASFDLPIDPALGYAYVVPFKRNIKQDDGSFIEKMEATFIIGWKGMHQLAIRTGVYKAINVIDVRDGELKHYDRLTEEAEIEFVEDEEERERLPVVGYIGCYRLINGFEKTVYMSVKQIEAHEKKHRKGKYMGKGWRDDFDAMARKTVYRNLIGKWGVMSIDYREQDQVADAVQADGAAYGENGEIILDGMELDETPLPETDENGEVVAVEYATEK